jgi:uncharacterized protein (TIGR02001 family)
VDHRRFVRGMLACAVCSAASAAFAQTAAPNLNGYVTLSNAYWKRGLAQNDGASAQLGIDFEHHTGFYVGAWAANVDFAYEYSAAQPRDIEVDVYAGYHRRRELWSWNVGLSRYAYPGTAIAYDYDEITATFGFRDRVFYSAAYSDSYYSGAHSALNQQVSIAFPLQGDFEIGATLGKFAIADGVLDITHWNVGVSKLVRRMSFDLRYYDGNYANVSYFGDPNAHHYVVSISYALRGSRPRT